MKLLFLGTRGETRDTTSPEHRLHTSLEVSYRGTRVMVDAGTDWQGRLEAVRPDAIVLTHAHPDHADGLRDGAPCPVWATQESFEVIRTYPIEAPRLVRPRESFAIGEIGFEAFEVEHSLTHPCVGYRVTAGRSTIFLAGDLIFVHDRKEALAGAAIYIGDAATLTESFVKRRGKRLIGHAPVRTQIGWCAAEGVPRAIFTHCGPGVVDAHAVAAGQIAEMGRKKGVAAELAVDGLEVVLR